MTRAEARAALLTALETMPEEAVSWLIPALHDRIWPDSIHGFSEASRTSIEAVQAAAAAWSEAHE